MEKYRLLTINMHLKAISHSSLRATVHIDADVTSLPLCSSNHQLAVSISHLPRCPLGKHYYDCD